MNALGADDWAALVTAALLGTDRRPLPDPGRSAAAGLDSVSILLDRAAAHRAATRAAAPLASCAAAPVAPAERLPAAPAAARALLAELLTRPDPALVNRWLAVCVAQRMGVGTEHWPRLADLAARSARYHRPLLRRALGPRGIWFLTQNPRWARLAATDDARMPSAPKQRRPGPDGTAASLVVHEQVLSVQARIDEVFPSHPSDHASHQVTGHGQRPPATWEHLQ